MLNHVAMEKVSSLLVSLVATIRSTAKLNSFLTILKKKKKSGLKRANPNSVRILLRRVRARFHLDSGVKLNVITKLKSSPAVACIRDGGFPRTRNHTHTTSRVTWGKKTPIWHESRGLADVKSITPVDYRIFFSYGDIIETPSHTERRCEIFFFFSFLF